MRGRYYVVAMWRSGNIGAHQIMKVQEQPEKGFDSYDNAEVWLKESNTDKFYDIGLWSEFAIMKIYKKNN